MKNKGVVTTDLAANDASAHFNHTSPNADKLILEYKNHLLMLFLHHH